MPITRQKKEELVAQYTKLLQDSQGIIITEFRGMTMSEFDALRAKMREVGSTYMVTKNNLLQLALDKVGMPVMEELITGPVAVAFAHQDLGATAKAVLSYHKDVDFFLVKGALSSKDVYDESGVKKLSELPSLDQLRGQLVGMIIAPASNILSLFNAPASDLVSVIDGGATQVLNVVAAYAAKQNAEAA